MSHNKHKQWMAAALIIISAMTGCAVSTLQGPSIDWVAPGEHQVDCTATEFKNTRPVRVQYRDIWQTEEYVLYQTASRQLEVIYAKASKQFTVSLVYQISIAAMVSTWNHNSRQNIEWGYAGRIDTQPGIWFYRTYTHSAPRRSCVGFLVEWDEIYEDPQVRPGKLLFGYYCSAGEEALEDQAVRMLIGGIRIAAQSVIPEPGSNTPGMSKDASVQASVTAGFQNSSALAAAKGSDPAATTGSPEFPFRFARYYRESGGGKLN